MSEQFFLRSPAGLGWHFRESDSGLLLYGSSLCFLASVSLSESCDVPYTIARDEVLVVDATARNLASAVAAVLTEGDRLACQHSCESWIERAARGGLRLTRRRSA